MVVKNVAGLDMAQADDRLVRHAGGHRGGQFQGDCRCPKWSAVSACRSIRRPTPSPRATRILDERAPARGDRSVESRSRREHRQSRLDCWPCAPAAIAAAVDRYEREATWPVAAGVAVETGARNRFWQTIARFHPALPVSRTRMARWCASSCTLKECGGDGVVPRAGDGARRLGRLLRIFRAAAGCGRIGSRAGAGTAGRRSSNSRRRSAKRSWNCGRRPARDMEIMRRIKHDVRSGESC